MCGHGVECPWRRNVRNVYSRVVPNFQQLYINEMLAVLRSLADHGMHFSTVSHVIETRSPVAEIVCTNNDGHNGED
jgi:hypothetical protein